MEKTAIVEKILDSKTPTIEAISWKSRLLHRPIKTLWFYLLVIINRNIFLKIPLKTKTIWGKEMFAYESSAIGSVYFVGYYDRDVTLFLLKHDHAQGDFLDIGSNIGYYSLLATQFTSAPQRILSIEPTPSTFEVLKRNVSNEEQITPLALALSDTIGTSILTDYGYRYAVFNSLKKQTLPFLKDKGKEFEVKTTTLDALCNDYNLHPAIIKLDTEGTESHILKGSQKVLETYSPVIILEVGGGKAWQENIAFCLDTLADRNYHLFELSDEGNLKKHQREETYTYKNLVCIPASKLSTYEISA